MHGQRSLATVFLIVIVILITVIISNADAQQTRGGNSAQYILKNVTKDTKVNTRLLTLPGGKNVKYLVSNPSLIRVDPSGAVYTRVAGERLIKAAGDRDLTVKSFSPDGSKLLGSSVLLAAGNNKPHFSDDAYMASVFENAAEGSLVLAVVAQDPDTDAISYYIEPPAQGGNHEEYEMFTISKLTGVIRLVQRRFTFTSPQYKFTVVAMDTGDLFDTATVTVNIIDVNDNRPEFPDCASYKPEVKENEDVGTTVLTVKAKDADKGKNAELVYALVTSPNAPESFFAIDELTGLLTTSKKFNRDAPEHEKSLRVIVKANDKGTPSLESTCAFIVTVLDVNDNTPLFDKKDYEAIIAKDEKEGAQVERVSATDDDIGKNADITYSLRAVYPATALDYFEIDESTGIISLSSPLSSFDIDYEFRLDAVATDQGNPARSASVGVFITVTESSLPPPTFSVPPKPSYTLPENYRDTETPVVTLRAVSNLPDSPKVYYELVHGGQEKTNMFRTFVVDESEDGAAIVRYGGTKQLDYEKTPAYNLTVIATTDQQTSAEVTFQVLLLDQNDEVPIFYDADQATVPENSPPQTFVTVVSAVDDDASIPNNQVTYSLERGSAEFQLFSIDSGTGRISTRVELDREDASRPSPFYTITVLAEDGAPSDISKNGRPNRAKQRITVEVGDVNDNAPKFDTVVDTAHVKENVDIGSKVLDIKATDVDSDSKINYQITDGNVGAAFDIDQVTGTVIVKNNLDYEAIRKYNITVTASDGKYEDTHICIIHVENQNDVAPQFDRPAYEKSMQEGYLSSTPIVTVTATDPDPIGEASIIYKLSGPGIYEDRPEDNVFSINDEGEIIVLKTLDRDEGTGGQEFWDISVQAWDDGGNGIFSSAPFQLTLSDINDNAPYLIQSPDSIPVIMENRAKDSIVISVEADDFDAHEQNGPPYSFELDRSADQDILTKFEVTTDEDQGTAVIRPKVTFDREDTKQYVIPIVVSDNPDAYPRSLTGTSLFTVIIGDENDNDMKPGSSVIHVFNFEGKMPATVIGRVYVDDPDDWDLPDKTFSWVEGDKRRFSLDSDTGNITILEGAANGSYPLKFSVYDKHWKSTVTADVTVVVRLLPREAVVQSGSLRIRHLTVEQFVTPADENTPSRYSGLISELARLFDIAEENVDLFGVQASDDGGVDVRYAAHGSPYYSSQKMNGVVGEHVRQLEETLKIEIQQVNIDDCINETKCDGNSCLSSLTIFEDQVHKVQTNETTIIGVLTEMQYTCGVCQAPAPPDPCLNGGHLVDDPEPRCECPDGYAGPNCEGLTIHFKGSGYAWFPHLVSCNSSKLSFDITTASDQGLVIYNGPLSEPTSGIQDFFAVDVSKGRLRAFLNYGAGTFVASPETPLDDGRRHHVDVLWDAQELTVLLDSCVGRPQCQASAPAPSSAAGVQHALLNVDAPLQLGGSAVPLSTVQRVMAWLEVPVSKGFFGCLENVTFLGTAYDLSNPSYGEEYSSYCEENIVPVPVIFADASFLAALITCLLFAVLLLAVGIFIHRRRTKRYKSYKQQSVEMNGVGQGGDGGSEHDNTSYDNSTLRVEDKQPRYATATTGHLTGTAALVQKQKDALDDDDVTGPLDDVRNYAYEGDGSMASSLSTINSGTTDADVEFDYLLELGPRFRRLADMYGADARAYDSDDEPRPAATNVHGSMPGESWC